MQFGGIGDVPFEASALSRVAGRLPRLRLASAVSTWALIPNTPVANTASRPAIRLRGSWQCSDRASESNDSGCVFSEALTWVMSIRSTSDWCRTPGCAGIGPTVGGTEDEGCQCGHR